MELKMFYKPGTTTTFDMLNPTGSTVQKHQFFYKYSFTQI